ncbi:hypothetical protein [Marinobacter algicola]|uniref:Uncharacterized protein n=1 Tax=Marinobacter algicola DG893 TaxID=443152 RepID=A6F0J5_9GAMM|nr:hypothetical protein [Marinobacter algicola]EDM47756.1 hypothetical protein MDG893_20589 [Marinobacter algicola DG893]
MIYTVKNTTMAGRPVKAFVNGNEIPGAYYADTDRGILKFYPQPARIKKPERDQAYTRTLRGTVTVEPVGSDQ